MRRYLDRLYSGSIYLAGGLIVAICLLVAAQVFLNAATRFLPFDLPPSIPSYAEISGFMLAAASFIALGPTLKAGQHIQITLLTQYLHRRWAPLQQVLVFAIGLAFTLYALFYVGGLVYESWEFGDKSFGSVKISLWLPQSTLMIGLFILAIAMLDELVCAILNRKISVGAEHE